MRLIFLVAILLGILTACSTSDTPTDIPFYTATPLVSGAVPRSEPDEPDGSFLQGLAGGNPVAIPQFGAFHITVTGDVEAISSSGSIVYNYVQAIGAVPDRDTIFISASDSTTAQQVAIEFSPGLPPDTYSITSPGSLLPGQITAQYLYIGESGEGSSTIQTYNQNVRGKLVLLETGASITGVFEFNAEWITGNISGETITRSVIVRGEFTDVPYLRRADPFDSDIPILERATIAPEDIRSP